MNYSILRPVVAGVLIGAALFFAPFVVLRIALFVLVFMLLFRLFTGRRFGRFGGRGMHPAFADRIRNMSDEEYADFKEKFGHGCGGPYRNQPENKPQ